MITLKVIVFIFLFIFSALEPAMSQRLRIESTILRTQSDDSLLNIPYINELKSRGRPVFNLDDFNPMPLPTWSPPKTISGHENHIMVYYPNSGIEETIPPPPLPTTFESSFSPGAAPGYLLNKGGGQYNEQSTVFNFSDLEIVNDPEVHPWSVNVKLRVFFPGNTRARDCSGVLIDAKHVLTAGHCVYSHDESAWVDSIHVIPAFENFTEHYGRAEATSVYSWSGWVDSHNYDWDMGYMVVDRAVGALTGWHGYGFNNSNSFFMDNIFHNPGYPGEPPFKGQFMYYWFGTYDGVLTEELHFNKKSFGGQSGSGAYFNNNGNRIVYATHSHIHPDGPEAGQTRITSDRFNSIRDRIANNTPSLFDLEPLNVVVSPTSIKAGSQLSFMSFLMHNYSSTTWNGTVNIKWFLSTNDFISSADEFLQERTFTGSLSPKHSLRLSVNSNLPVIPSTISGNYWIGVILDIADANPSNNNIEDWDASSVIVIPAPILSVSTANIEVGEQSGGQSFSSNFVIRNVGAARLTGMVSYSAPFITSLSPTSFSLTAGQEKLINIVGRFPLNAGPFSGQIEITSNADVRLINLIGTTTVPVAFKLYQNYPNPFQMTSRSGVTMIRLDLPGTEETDVELLIYNLRGQLVRQLTKEGSMPSVHEILWDGNDKNGQALPSGVYIYYIKAGRFNASKRLTLLR